MELHSHTFDANIDLFENFIENFIEIEVKFKRTLKDDFIELHLFIYLFLKLFITNRIKFKRNSKDKIRKLKFLRIFSYQDIWVFYHHSNNLPLPTIIIIQVTICRTTQNVLTNKIFLSYGLVFLSEKLPSAYNQILNQYFISIFLFLNNKIF